MRTSARNPQAAVNTFVSLFLFFVVLGLFGLLYLLARVLGL